MSAKSKPSRPPDEPGQASKVNFFPAWCKRCGNCVAFCPRKALAKDEWGHPVLAKPERCTTCGLCEMLCPDFALSVGPAPAEERPRGEAAGQAADMPAASFSPERLAPVEEDDDEEEGGNG
ncbi:MAG: 4Fe-4S binding protein [Deltaproteobacteria bacterium]|nr:4Fe-4S binding protein [Deltaproteobacteria bacterium]